MDSSTGLSIGHRCSVRPISVAFWLGVQVPQCFQVYLWQFLVDQIFPEVTQSALAVASDLFELWSLHYIQWLFYHLGSLNS